MRRTKIVCTLGPASEDIEILRSMIRAGMEVARLNFSHGSHKEHLRRIKAVREAAKLEDRLVPMMLDMKGPEIRIGELKDEPLQLKEGNNIVLTSKIIQGTEEAVSITYDKLPEDIKRGDVILLDDGIISLKVEDVSGSEIRCIVVEGGGLKSHKGVNVPGVEVRLPPVTEKDYEDIMFGIEKGIDFIAISFVKKAEDILEVRKILEDKNNEKIKVIAKIENQAGVNNIDDILQVVDGVMVARGDLGVEIPPEEVPLIQKN